MGFLAILMASPKNYLSLFFYFLIIAWIIFVFCFFLWGTHYFPKTILAERICFGTEWETSTGSSSAPGSPEVPTGVGFPPSVRGFPMKG